MTPIDLYARWGGFVENDPTDPEEFITKTHAYRVQIPPHIPLSLGIKIRVVALSPTRYCIPDAPADLYDMYDPHVIGDITRVMGWKGDVVGLEVTNECKISPVRRARLELPYIPDVTVQRITGLRLGRGPRVAAMTAFAACTIRGVLGMEGRCGVAQCAMRATALAGEAILDEFWLPGCREVPPRRKSSIVRKKKRGNLEELGWIRDDTEDGRPPVECGPSEERM